MAHQTHIADLFLEHDGIMSFERYMREALYHPRYGYYASNISSVGKRGDFSTSATISTMLGKAIGQWALNQRTEVLGLGFGKRWNVIEIGAGDGSLARSFVDGLGTFQRRFVNYHIVDVSEPLRRKQQEKLGRRAQWHETMEEALTACEGEAIIFSNELIDAFPATIVRWNSASGTWQELYLRDQGVQGFSEEYRPLSVENEAAGSSVFGSWDHPEIPLKDGQRCEILFSYRKWLQPWLSKWQRGTMLTIDYGGSFPELYRKRPNGTLRGYFQGVRLEGDEVFDRFGHQDLTVDVNFTDVCQWSTAEGLETVQERSQREFLLETLPQLEDFRMQQQDSALEFLLSTYGAGNAFRVLEQRTKSS